LYKEEFALYPLAERVIRQLSPDHSKHPVSLYDTLQLFFPMYAYQAVFLLFRFCVFVLFCFIGVLLLAL
jgi:hypothetical protein